MLGQTNKKILSDKLQRTLRNNLTNAEKALWCILRGRQISGVKSRRQHPFGNYILDFVSLEIKLAIEVDGSQHGKVTEYDVICAKELQAAGFQVLRFWNNEVLQNIEAVKEKIWMVVQERKPHPYPDLPLEGDGVRGIFSQGA